MNTKVELEHLELLIEDLKRKYDLFFQGLLRVEPSKEKKALEMKLRTMGQRNIPNTSDQFKFNTIQARFHSYQNMWSRIVTAIEEGRIERDSGGRVAFHSHGPVDEDNMNKAFIDFLNAKKDLNQPADGIEFSSFRKKLFDRATDMTEKGDCERVEFKVVVEDGKAKIKAIKK
ncbi:MAG: hypothetical protein OEM19_03575 [Deltaproteobacteria bacterium]|nr:hypothetical protein [Deltaproteobacteria bacterium]